MVPFSMPAACGVDRQSIRAHFIGTARGVQGMRVPPTRRAEILSTFSQFAGFRSTNMPFSEVKETFLGKGLASLPPNREFSQTPFSRPKLKTKLQYIYKCTPAAKILATRMVYSCTALVFFSIAFIIPAAPLFDQVPNYTAW